MQTSRQLAFISSPLLMEGLFAQQQDFPFFVTLIPALTITVVMVMCKYLPGGSVAGQISLKDCLEHQQKVDYMNEDNEYETDFLGNTSIGGGTKDDKKRPTRYVSEPVQSPGFLENDCNEEMDYFTPSVALRLSAARGDPSSYGEEMEI